MHEDYAFVELLKAMEGIGLQLHEIDDSEGCSSIDQVQDVLGLASIQRACLAEDVTIDLLEGFK
jgi:hypothetical protein